MCGWGLPVPSPYKLHFSNVSKHLEDFVKRILRVVRRQVAHKHISLAIDLQTGSKQHVTNDVMVNKNIAVTSHPPAPPDAVFVNPFRDMKTGCGCCLAPSGRVRRGPCCDVSFSTCCGVCAIWSSTSTLPAEAVLAQSSFSKICVFSLKSLKKK